MMMNKPLLLKLFFVFTELWFHFSMSRKDMLAAVQVGNRHDPWLGRADRKGANRKQETGNWKLETGNWELLVVKNWELVEICGTN